MTKWERLEAKRRAKVAADVAKHDARRANADARNERYVRATERQADAIVALAKVFGVSMKKLTKKVASR